MQSDILYEILQWCEHRDLARWMRVCKRFNRVIRQFVGMITYTDPYLPFRAGMYLVIDRILDDELDWNQALEIACINNYHGIARKILTYKVEWYPIRSNLFAQLCNANNISMIRLLTTYENDQLSNWIYIITMKFAFSEVMSHICWLESKGFPVYWERVMQAVCELGNKESIKSAISEMIKRRKRINWNAGLEGACTSDNVETIKFIKQCAEHRIYGGTLDWNIAFRTAFRLGNYRIADLARKNGATGSFVKDRIDQETFLIE